MRNLAFFLFLLGINPLCAQQPTPPAPATQQQPSDLSDSVPADKTLKPAAKPAPQDDVNTERPEETIRVKAREVNVIFTVTDKRGKFVKDLNKDNFEVFDNKKRVQDIRFFDKQTDLPLRVGLLIEIGRAHV